MPMTIAITIPAIPIPKGRPRLGRNGAHNPESTVDYENLVRWTAKASRNEIGWKKLAGDIKCRVEFYGPRKGDIDNLLKSLFDGLNGIAFDDDKQIRELHAICIDADFGETIVRIEPCHVM